MKVLVAMSGGVDSSVAAALLAEAGHDVAGVTLKLWGGASDRGCCSVADVDDARRVAQQLGIAHYVFGLADDFSAGVVEPYVAAHAAGLTPNPCVECNRHLKFDRLLRRALVMGYDALATGHHARVGRVGGRWSLRRGADAAKDQSYVLHMLGQAHLARVLFPVGERTKDEVRAHAGRLGLRTAGKADSQDVCFVAGSDRRAFLGDRIPLHPGRVVDTAGEELGRVPAVELVTVGQRRGLGLPGGTSVPRYAVAVDVAARTVTVGDEADLQVDEMRVARLTWVDGAVAGPVLAQCSAHGAARRAVLDGDVLRWERPRRRIAPGQSVVLYDGDAVLGGGTAA